jgi:predicted nucleic acid-binding protein
VEPLQSIDAGEAVWVTLRRSISGRNQGRFLQSTRFHVQIALQSEIGFNPLRFKDASQFSVLLRARNHAVVHTQGELLHIRMIIRNLVRAIHIAVMQRYGIRSILSFDGGFDRWPGLERIDEI